MWRNPVSKIQTRWQVNKKYYFKFSNRFAAVENLDDDADISSTWEIIRENVSS
jgi:hypothetical protein